MTRKNKHQSAARDWNAIAKGHGFQIPEVEIERLATVLDELVSDCTNSMTEDLSQVEPIGTFHPEEP